MKYEDIISSKKINKDIEVVKITKWKFCIRKQVK